MENYSSTTRFIFLLENPTTLIPAIRSRCHTISLSKPSEEQVKKKLREITKKEEIKLSEDALDAIIYLTNNDYTQSLNIIDSIKNKNQEITIKEIKEFLEEIKIKNYEESIKKAIKGEVKEAINLIDELIFEENTKFSELIKEWRKQIHNLSINQETKKELLLKLAEFDKDVQELPRDPNQMKKLGRTHYEKYLSSIPQQ